MDVVIRQSEVKGKLRRLKAAVAGAYLEEVDELGEIEGFEVEYLYTR